MHYLSVEPLNGIERKDIAQDLTKAHYKYLDTALDEDEKAMLYIDDSKRSFMYVPADGVEGLNAILQTKEESITCLTQNDIDEWLNRNQ